MIALRKLERQGTSARLRKAAELLRRFEAEIRMQKPVDSYYLSGLAGILFRSDTREHLRSEAAELEKVLQAEGPSLSHILPTELGRRCGSLAAELRQLLGILPGDWDLTCGITDTAGNTPRRIMSVDLFLEDLRSPFNVGTIFRTAEAFGVRHIYLSPTTPGPEQPRTQRSSMGTVDRLSWSKAELGEVLAGITEGSGNYSPVALETGGTAVAEFDFPREGLLIIGNEEWGVSAAALNAATARLTIPMGGSKASLNVAVATGIALQRWFEKCAPD